MQFRSLWLIILLLLIHPLVYAGESISISKIESLQPIVSVRLSEGQLKLLHRQNLDNASGFLSVHMLVNDKAAVVAVAGRYSLAGKRLSFIPMQSLGYDMVFEIQYKNEGKIIERKTFKTPGHPLSDVQATAVTAYPISDTIPFNTLFFHIRFSHPMMNDKDAYKHIKMYDDKGVERKNAWRQRSFWLDGGKLLVLMIHPGRVKNGIHYESPLFELNKTYTLKVSKEINDINGNPVAADYEQKYYIVAEDRESPAVDFRKINVPDYRTRDPLIISFSEGMDNASVLEGVKVYDAGKNIVPCIIKERDNDNQYTITPINAWQKQQYTLMVGSAVYDFAANRLYRLFEITDVEEMEKDNTNTIWQFDIN